MRSIAFAILAAGLTASLAVSPASAQRSGGSSSAGSRSSTSTSTTGVGTSATGASTTGIGTTVLGAPTTGTSTISRGAPALGTIPTGPVTPNRSNTDLYPPSRLLDPSEGATISSGNLVPNGQGTLTSQGTGAATTGTASGTTPQSGGSATQTTDPNAGATATGSGTTQGSTTTPNNNGQSVNGQTTNGQSTNGVTTTGGTGNFIGQIEPNSQTSSGSATATNATNRPSLPGGDLQTPNKKSQENDAYVACLKIWDAQTHMSKSEWSSTCHRVQGRLNSVSGR